MAIILAVDDSETIRELVSVTLKRSGHDVVTAKDGNDGLQKAKGGRFDLILSDINMPGMDGFEMIRQIRTLPSHKYTPILTLTTESSADKKQKGKEVGASGWIVKPFQPDLLLKAVSRFVK